MHVIVFWFTRLYLRPIQNLLFTQFPFDYLDFLKISVLEIMAIGKGMYLTPKSPTTIQLKQKISDSSRTKYAVQSLVLSSGGHTIAWQNQLDRLNMACTFASRFLKLPLSKCQFSNKLYMQRSVFTKVRLTLLCQNSSYFHPAYSPFLSVLFNKVFTIFLRCLYSTSSELTPTS